MVDTYKNVTTSEDLSEFKEFIETEQLIQLQ